MYALGNILRNTISKIFKNTAGCRWPSCIDNIYIAND